MKRKNWYLSLAVLALSAGLLTSCGNSLRKATASTVETDDVYFSSEDRKAEDRAAAKAKAREESYSRSDEYEEGLAAKNGNDGLAQDPSAMYEDDDFYYSRRLRRFNNPGQWGYYDPYFSYDPYFTMNRPGWNTFNSGPWWYDPWSYNGPSWAWTTSWGYGYGAGFGYGMGYNPYTWGSCPASFYYPGFYNNGWGYGNGFGYGYGFGNYYGFGYDPYWTGYYNGFNNGYWCGSYGGFNPGNNWGGTSGGGSTGHFGPRTNPSTLNTNNHPANEITPDERSLRPYQSSLGTAGYYQGNTNPFFTPSSSGNNGGTSTPMHSGNGNNGRVITDEPSTTRPANEGRNIVRDQPTENRGNEGRTYTPATTRPDESRPTYVRPQEEQRQPTWQNNQPSRQENRQPTWQNNTPARQETRPAPAPRETYTPRPSSPPPSSSPSRNSSGPGRGR